MARPKPPDWSGRTVACIASGPSLTAEDCAAVQAAGLPTIVTNTTFRMCPWADVLFAFDTAWWRVYREEVARDFRGALWSVSHQVTQWGVHTTYCAPWFKSFANSGACAVSFAFSAGARKVVLLGYDSMPGPAGEHHWHGAHEQGLSNCASIKRWPGQFRQVAAEARTRGVLVVNASRRTALDCFPRVDLSDALA